MNKKGYVLVYALGIITVLMILCASLTSITMTRSNWANKNAYIIKERAKAIASIEAAASEIIYKFNEINHNTISYKSIKELATNANLVDYFTFIESTYNVKINNISKASCSEEYCFPYTNEYEIVYNNTKDFTASKRFFISMIPSFLYFALGSNSDIMINGGAYIDGNTYVKNNLFVSNVTNYSRGDNLYTEANHFLTVAPNRSMYIGNQFYSCRNETLACFNIDNVNQHFLRNNPSYRLNVNETFYTESFSNTPPSILKYSDRFLNVDFDASFKYYLSEAIRHQDNDMKLDDINNEITGYISNNWLKKINSIAELSTSIGPVVLVGNQTISEDLKYNDWVIINGDLSLEAKDIETKEIAANILVTGNITITGNIAFNSTIYALGQGNIVNAAISGLDNNQLVLLTKESLNFTAINAFRNNFSEHITYYPSTNLTIVTPHIKGFFYTDSYAEIYTAASYIVLEGGIFANDKKNHTLLPLALNDYENHTLNYVNGTDSMGLVFNSFRGSVTDEFEFTKYYSLEQSRLVIKHNLDIIKNQPKGLPINTQFNYIFEGVVIK